MIRTYKRKSNWAAVAAAASFVTLLALANDAPCGACKGEGTMLALSIAAFCASLIAAFWFLIKAKARSGWWILLLLLQFVGMVVIALLQDRAQGDQHV